MAEMYSILLAGLNASETSFISKWFSRFGHEVIAAADAAEARERLNAQHIDLVYLQNASEEKAANKLEGIAAAFPSLPIILVCASASEGTVLDAWRAGAADILFLPLTAESLNASLQRSMRRSHPSEIEKTVPVGARLFYIDENGKQRTASIIPPRFRLGRGLGNNLSFTQLAISRTHAEIVIQEGKYLLRDLGSKSGTYLNGTRVEEARLADGDLVQLGGAQGTSLTFHTADILQSLLGGSEAGAEIGLSIHGFKDIGKLFAAFRAFSSIPVLDDLLALVVDTAIELTGAERGFIMLKEKNGELSFRCARNNEHRPLDGSCFQTSQRVPQEVFKTGRPSVIKDLDVGDGAETHNFTRQLGLRSISCVPLRYFTLREADGASTPKTAEMIGVLYVDSVNIGAAMSEVQVDALETLASEAAMAIYNARLYKDSQDKLKMDEQLAVAREIQQALFPQHNKDLGYARACSQSIPCYDIGGDYFDYFDLDDGRFGFALGDVAGKGMPAALLASLIQGVFSTQTFMDAPLSTIIGKVNRNLAQRSTGSRFVTFFFGILDSDGNCTYVNAGHNPPFLLKPDGSMKELTTGGMVLGLISSADYESAGIKLEPDDHLVLFTDGLTEALNTKGEEFGIDRLTEVLRKNARSTAPEILARLQEAVLAFSADAPQHDDITMTVIGFRETRA